MWLHSIQIKNIKCFKETKKIFFTITRKSNSERPVKWITLLGENGVGKSTMLQAIGIMLAGPEAAKELLPRPEGWVRDPAKVGEITASIKQDDVDEGTYGTERLTTKFSYTYWITGDQKITIPISGRKEIKEETYTEPTIIEKTGRLLSWLRSNAFGSETEGWFSAGYGAFRRLTRERRILIPSLSSPTRASNFLTQFNDDEPLSSFERWMVYLEFRIAKDPNDQQAQRMKEVGAKVIEKLLPDNAKVHQVTEEGNILFSINNQVVSTVSLSDGYRSIIALAGDLIWRLMQTFPDMEDPTQAPGVVLIDELGIHLHPVWQRKIATWLRETFPNLQFIIATHSPFIAVGAGEDALTLRFEFDPDSEDVSITEVENIAHYDVDKVLQSEAFDLVSTYSPQTAQKIEQYKQLRLKFDRLNPDERQLFDELQVLMNKIKPYGTHPEPDSVMDRVNRFLEENLP